uniref:NADH-ubiquinone oxidoreductase chain 6 n=1 Tax=Tuta absoluta TaxID=702717 RepID=A0A7H1JKB7_TUTAB|nr:NADH dehydrogenase subunit 6 [Tuta absoluta]QNT11856.1 NADH dehydrogenase subunit 6 [Tuta absoluta]UJM44073.1 NADH dehydrogenase subunit 6 [Tuta absoluta]UJM44086.1 NADH dehydrogenase subunit 6 [Tuta absoluta]
MAKMFFSILLIIISFLMFFLNHPLSMGLMILMQTFLTCILSGLIIKTYWFSYVLFLTFLGGLLVLFIYVSSIASNEMFFFSFKMKMFFLFTIIISLFISLLFIYNLNWMNFINNSDMENFFNNYLFFNNENKINLTKLYNNQTFLLMIMLIIYLFITLVAVVKITNIFSGPLRTSI